MRKYKLGDIATVEISGVDKKVKDGEENIHLERSSCINQGQ